MPQTESEILVLFYQDAAEKLAVVESRLAQVELEKSPEARLDIVLDLLRIVHSLKGSAGFMELRQIETACHFMEDLLAAARRRGGVVEPETVQSLLAAVDAISATVRMLEAGEDISSSPIQWIWSDQEHVVPDVVESRDPPPSAPVSPKRGKALPQADGVRVSAGRLDRLLYCSEDLVVSRLRANDRVNEVEELRELALSIRHDLSRAGVSSTFFSDFERRLRELSERLNDDGRILRESTHSLEAEVRRARMQPFSQACIGLGRVVRTSCSRLGKKAELVVEGGHHEIDRSILDGLDDILKQIARNAITHGIESPGERVAAGKPETGSVVVSARVTGDRLLVEVQDDGRGIDMEALRRDAELNGRPVDEVTVMKGLFQPGYSTAAEVTQLAGRGVGLDLVRSSVERLRGIVTVENNAGAGATFSISLPLSLAVTRAFIVTAGCQDFAIETAATSSLKVFEGGTAEWDDAGRLMYTDGGRTFPALHLAAWLGRPSCSCARGDAPLIGIWTGTPGASGDTVIFVDKVWGEQEILVRPLGPRLVGLRQFSGCSALPGKGNVLVLNVAALSEAAALGSAWNGRPGKVEQITRPRVLVADDSEIVRRMQKESLEAAGYAVVTAADGSEAWEKLKAGVDVVIADVDMPVVDGLEFTRKARSSRAYSHLPIYLLTSHDTQEAVKLGVEAGATGYLIKGEYDQQRVLTLLAAETRQ